jgi:predicted DNA-binding protein (MmcQ/YjbR family)
MAGSAGGEPARLAGDAAATVRGLALSFPEAFEDHPFGPTDHVFKIGPKRMFGIMDEGPPLRLTVKLTAEEREVALLLPFVREARYVGRYGWVTATVEDTDGLRAALEWLRESYWLRAPIGLREAAWAAEPAAQASQLAGDVHSTPPVSQPTRQ